MHMIDSKVMDILRSETMPDAKKNSSRTPKLMSGKIPIMPRQSLAITPTMGHSNEVHKKANNGCNRWRQVEVRHIGNLFIADVPLPRYARHTALIIIIVTGWGLHVVRNEHRVASERLPPKKAAAVLEVEDSSHKPTVRFIIQNATQSE